MSTSMKVRLLATLSAVIISTGLPVFAQTIPAQGSDTKGQLSVSLKSPVSLDFLISALNKDSFDFVTAQSSFSANGRTIQDFAIIVSADTASGVSTRWVESRKALIEQLKRDGFFNKEDGGAFSVSSITDTDINTVELTNVTLHGSKKSLTNISTQISGSPGEFKSNQEIKANRDAENNKKADRPRDLGIFSLGGDQSIVSAAAANVPYYTLAPVSGSLTSGLFYSRPGATTVNRGVINYMRWVTNGFGSDQTYEHDFFLENTSSNPGTYFARTFSAAPWCQPSTVYAATSWPSAAYPYLDSDLEYNGLCSSTGNIAYTIGAAQANAITAGVSHFTQIIMPDGDATTDRFQLYAQVGYRYPTSCTSTLCSFAYGYGQPSNYQTTSYTLNTGAVPATYSWTWSGKAPPAPINLSVATPPPLTLNCPQTSCQKVAFTDISWDETNVVLEIWKSGYLLTSFNFGILNAGTMAGTWTAAITGLTSKTNYCYRMKNVNAINSSTYTPSVCNTTL